MVGRVSEALSLRLKWSLGFGCFLAWLYCSFFSCGLVPVIFLVRSIERTWVYVGCAQLIAAVAIMALFWRSVDSSRACVRRMGVSGAAFAAVGSILIWISFLDKSWHAPLSISGGLLAGVGLALLVVVWGAFLSGCEDESVEFIVPAGFVFSFVSYFVLVAIKGPLFMVVDALLPSASIAAAFWAICDQRASARPDEGVASAFGDDEAAPSGQIKRLGTLFLLYAILWFQFALFRVISSPETLGDRFIHYLAPFTCASILSAIAFVVCIKHSRFLNFTFMYRWSVPLMVISYGVLFLDSGGLYDEKSVAYTINFIAMFGVQLCMWIVAPKYVRRMGVSAVFLFGGFAAAEGAGVALGLMFSLPAIGRTSEVMGLSLLLMGVLLLVAMMVGFNPRWLFFNGVKKFYSMEDRTASRIADLEAGEPPRIEDAPEMKRSELEELFERESLKLQSEYGLTKRETEIAALLLTGRSRPFIRDELMISLSTVHAHVRNIYAKCDVHSQQEFMDLIHITTK